MFNTLRVKFFINRDIKILASATQAQQTHSYATKGVYTVQVTVFDSQGATALGTTLVTIGGADLAPLAFATATPTDGEAPLLVSFMGLGTDMDGSIAAYHWNFGDASSSDEQNPVHLYRFAGTFIAELTVTDNEGAQHSDSVVIRVRGPGVANLAPVIQKIPDQTAVIQQAFSYQVIAYDFPGDPLTFAAAGLPAGISIDTHAGLISGTATQLGVFRATVTVTDSYGASSSESFTLTVLAAPPGPAPSPSTTKDQLGLQVSRAQLVKGEYPNIGELILTNIKVLNDGTLRLKDVQIRVSVPELGISDSLLVRDLHKKDDQVRSLALQLPDYAAPGEYTVRITISNDEVHKTLHRSFTVLA